MRLVSLAGVIAKTADASIPLGSLRTTTKGGIFMRVALATTESVLPVAGSPLGWRNSQTAGQYKVTSDISNSSSLRFCGIAMAAPTTTLKYFWMCVQGNPYDIGGITIKSDGNIAANSRLAWAADKVVTTRTAQPTSTAPWATGGFSLAADSGSQCLVCQVTTMGAAQG